MFVTGPTSAALLFLPDCLGLVFVPEIGAEMRLRFSAGNLDRNLGSGAVLLEKWVHGFQQYRLPTRYHLRKRRIHSRFAMKIEYVAIQAVSPSQIYARARNFELQL